jgi:hypothetical protein
MNRVKLLLTPRGEDGISRREATNSPLAQGTAETIKYYVDFTDWGASSSAPCTTPVVTVLLSKDDTDKTSTIHSADDATVVSDVEVEFTLSAFGRYQAYMVYVKTTIGSEIVEAFCQMEGVR